MTWLALLALVAVSVAAAAAASDRRVVGPVSSARSAGEEGSSRHRYPVPRGCLRGGRLEKRRHRRRGPGESAVRAMARLSSFATWQMVNSTQGSRHMACSSRAFPSANARSATAIAQDRGTGKLVVAGGYGQGSMLVMRLTARGRLDPTFGARRSGFATVAVGGIASSLAIQPNGAIVLGGSNANRNGRPFVVARFTRDGVLDRAFGHAGIAQAVFWNPSAASSAGVNGLAIAPGGGISRPGISTTSVGRDAAAPATELPASSGLEQGPTVPSVRGGGPRAGQVPRTAAACRSRGTMRDDRRPTRPDHGHGGRRSPPLRPADGSIDPARCVGPLNTAAHETAVSSYPASAATPLRPAATRRPGPARSPSR